MKWFRRLFGESQAPSPASLVTEQPTKSEAPAACKGSGAPKEINLRQGAPEFDLFIARGTLDLGENLSHGARHLADLLQVDPTNVEWQALIDRYIEAAKHDIDTLVPDTEPRYAATEALRGYLWQTQGRTADAIARLIDVCKAQGKAQYLHAWVLDWLEPEGVVEALPEQSGLVLFGFVLTHCGEANVSSARSLSYMRRWAQLIERAAPRYGASGLLTMVRAGLLRKAGMFDEAIAVTGPLDSAQEFSHAIAIGLAFRGKRLYRESAEAFAKALEIEPSNITGYLEAGDTYFEACVWDKALQQYEAALKLVPAHLWAEPSAWYCHWKFDGGDEWSERIRASATSGNQRAHALLFREFGALSESGDATANILRQVRAAWINDPPKSENQGGKIEMSLSTLEAPSNRLAFALEMAAFKQNVDLKVAIASIPTLDPRRPLSEVRYLLWHFDGTNPVPALPAPSPTVLVRIAELAAQAYDPYANWARASHVAVALGVEKVTEILAVMVHPPALPVGAQALAWLPRVQLAAAQVVGQIDDGWDTSVRREVLLALLYGPMDWTTTAAIRVLAWIAREEPAHATDIHHAFERLEGSMPKEGYWDWISVLYQEWPTLPYLFDGEREAMRTKLASMQT